MTDAALIDDWYPVAKLDELACDTLHPARVLGMDVVVWKSTDGELSVFEDRCPHRAVPLSKGHVAGGHMVCAYHGWAFDQRGSCVAIPAQPGRRAPSNSAVKRFQAREHVGLLWVCLGEPAQPPPEFPEWHDARFAKAFFGPYRFEASPFRVVENAFDVPHFAILHATQLGDAARAEMRPFEVVVQDGVLRMENIRIWQPNIDGMGTHGEVRYDHVLTRPLTLYTVKTFEAGRETALFAITPVDHETAVAWGWAAFDHGKSLDVGAFRAYQDALYEDDRAVVEAQRPRRLPLLPFSPTRHAQQPEVHLESDRGSVAYRRWLRALGIDFGVC